MLYSSIYMYLVGGITVQKWTNIVRNRTITWLLVLLAVVITGMTRRLAATSPVKSLSTE